MSVHAVTAKPDFYRRWNALEFGNRGPTWDTLHEAMVSDYPGPFAIRYRQPASRWCRYNIPKSHLPDAVNEFMRQGADITQMEFSIMQPDDRLTFQGEVQRDYRGLVLFGSTLKAPMRVALRSAQQVSGLRAQKTLEHYCDAASCDDILSLLDRYPGHVVEFGCYSINVGVLPHRNTVIWEVRQY